MSACAIPIGICPHAPNSLGTPRVAWRSARSTGHEGAITLPALIERFFTRRLIRQRNVSPHTIASYRDTFRLLLQFTQRHLKITPVKP